MLKEEMKKAIEELIKSIKTEGYDTEKLEDIKKKVFAAIDNSEKVEKTKIFYRAYCEEVDDAGGAAIDIKLTPFDLYIDLYDIEGSYRYTAQVNNTGSLDLSKWEVLTEEEINVSFLK